jgi:hypothetical protein
LQKALLQNLPLYGKSEQHVNELWGALIVYAWRVYNIKHPRLRLLLLIVYGVGFVLLFIPAAWTFVQVTRFGIRHLYEPS